MRFLLLPSGLIFSFFRLGCGLAVCIMIAFLQSACGTKSAPVFIVISTDDEPGIAAEKQRLAKDLADGLNALYPDRRFETGPAAPGAPYILLATLQDTATLSAQNLLLPGLTGEGFAGGAVPHSADSAAYLVGGSVRGLAYAVYRTLEKAGAGFYLSYQTMQPAGQPFRWSLFNHQDRPLASQRVVFNWHNFLSGCTAWNLPDWQFYIDQSVKMGYNTLMVHAYGNNPLFSFEYNGVRKEVGFMNTTNSGRDWGNQHVNDVRRLIGGELFEGAVFGADAAKVPDEQREKAATELMQDVFAHAAARQMQICLAVDVDTDPANPQNILATLPSHATFLSIGRTLALPDTDEGYAYYRAQIKQLMELYPQVNILTLWSRKIAKIPSWLTPWRGIRQTDLPPHWQKAIRDSLNAHPELRNDPYVPSSFALAQMMKAARQALDELGYRHVRLATGSWEWSFLPSTHVFFPKEVIFYPLDWGIDIEKPENMALLSKVGAQRELVPVVWAHHDDHRYVGRPYTPFSNFNSLLGKMNTAGFGIIHWTTRPLDLYFKSLGEQVWASAENQPLAQTLTHFARRTFGSTNPALLDYLKAWLTEGPMFGRETSDHFMDLGKQEHGEAQEPIEKTLERVAGRERLLAKVSREGMSAEGAKHLAYFAENELFYKSFFRNQQLFDSAWALLSRKETDRAAALVAQTDPENAIRTYVQAARHLVPTPGEKALVVSLNLRWLTDFQDLRQQAGLVAVRYRFAPTHHDPLAQGAGNHTFYVDSAGVFWKVLGKKELANPCIQFTDQWADGNCPMELPVRSFNHRPLPQAPARVELLSQTPHITVNGQQGKPIPEGPYWRLGYEFPLPPETLRIEGKVGLQVRELVVESGNHTGAFQNYAFWHFTPLFN